MNLFIKPNPEDCSKRSCRILLPTKLKPVLCELGTLSPPSTLGHILTSHAIVIFFLFHILAENLRGFLKNHHSDDKMSVSFIRWRGPGFVYVLLIIVSLMPIAWHIAHYRCATNVYLNGLSKKKKAKNFHHSFILVQNWLGNMTVTTDISINFTVKMLWWKITKQTTTTTINILKNEVQWCLFSNQFGGLFPIFFSFDKKDSGSASLPG